MVYVGLTSAFPLANGPCDWPKRTAVHGRFLPVEDCHLVVIEPSGFGCGRDDEIICKVNQTAIEDSEKLRFHNGQNLELPLATFR